MSLPACSFEVYVFAAASSLMVPQRSDACCWACENCDNAFVTACCVCLPLPCLKYTLTGKTIINNTKATPLSCKASCFWKLITYTRRITVRPLHADMSLASKIDQGFVQYQWRSSKSGSPDVVSSIKNSVATQQVWMVCSAS